VAALDSAAHTREAAVSDLEAGHAAGTHVDMRPRHRADAECARSPAKSVVALAMTRPAAPPEELPISRTERTTPEIGILRRPAYALRRIAGLRRNEAGTNRDLNCQLDYVSFL
jgi:hypothetical protein